MPVFCTVLHNLKSPQNVGAIVRTNVAFGGGPVVFVGHNRPWEFKKSTQAFSRKLERLCELVFLENDETFFSWCDEQGYEAIGIEIAAQSHQLPDYSFPERTALVVGNEGRGLSSDFLGRCKGVVTIPHFGEVECLNVGVSCAIAIYELNRCRIDVLPISGSKFMVDRATNYGD